MKLIAASALLTMSFNTFASVECLGETASGKIVSVRVETVGTMGGIRDGLVSVKDKNGTTTSYTLPKAEISQFYESYRTKKQVVVGLDAYTHGWNNRLAINYLGVNAFDNILMDSASLESHLKDPKRKKQSGNTMAVPKIDIIDADGFSKGSYEFKDVVCALDMDV